MWDFADKKRTALECSGEDFRESKLTEDQKSVLKDYGARYD